MTQEQILSLPHLSIAEVTSFIHIHSEDGYVICNLPEDIADYYYTNCLWLNKDEEQYDDLSVITEEENAEIMKRVEEAIKMRENENNED